MVAKLHFLVFLMALQGHFWGQYLYNAEKPNLDNLFWGVYFYSDETFSFSKDTTALNNYFDLFYVNRRFLSSAFTALERWLVTRDELKREAKEWIFWG